ncbi:MAG TPA: helicase-associated domain-containing protein [Pseudonocardiaceae bacterium]
MSSGSFAGYLAGLDEAGLRALLRSRPDVLMQPVPRGFEQLAQRLTGPDSLVAALRSVNRDAIVTGQSVAAVGTSATVATLARLLGASEAAVRDAVDELCGWGLAWREGATIVVPERLALHWSAEIGGGRSAAAIARSALVEDLRSTAAALGVETDGLRKPELVSRLDAALADAHAIAEVVGGLPRPARDRLDQLRSGYGAFYPGYAGPGPSSGASVDRVLAGAGLLVRVNGRWEMPREVGVAAWLAERDLLLTGRPDIARVTVAASSVLAATQAAVQDLLRAVTALLDEAGSSAITALKKGGVGPRERSRLAVRLSVPADVLLMAIDLAYAAGLLGRAEAGYAPTERYADWRAALPARQWAELVTAWFVLEHAPTSREIQGDKELPPPLPLASAAGSMRRVLVRIAAGGYSVRAVGEQIDWFFPLHGYDDAQRRDKVAAVVREAELMGVVAADVVTECGLELVAVFDGATEHDESLDVADQLAGRVAGLLPETPCTVILQSDLTAVVSGQPTVAVARVLGAAAVSEARGAAGVWRFTPASVRAALDAGWTAAGLVAELTAVSDRPLPQPLEYLVADVARRHGLVRVRGMRSCVVADETMITEILHTRSLTKLRLARVAPTVLSSPVELDEVLARLRAAGLSPVAEDAEGAVVVEARSEHRAQPSGPARGAPRGRLAAAELAQRLLADPTGERGDDLDTSETVERLAELNPDLDDAELMLLSDAVDHQRDVLITYRNQAGNRTVREIQPRRLYGAWLDSWCHLRDAQRDFTVANIESVAPAG